MVGPQTAPVTSYTYNANGNRVTETNALGKVTTWAYDNLNRMTQITQPDPDGAGALASKAKRGQVSFTKRPDPLFLPSQLVTV